jgi:hypothetical protein
VGGLSSEGGQRNVPGEHVVPGLPQEDEPRCAVRSEDDRDTPGAVVVVGHRVAVRARDRHRQQIADGEEPR